MAQNNPSPTPMTGNPVLTTAVITAFVATLIQLVRAYGHDITGDQENAVLTFLQGPEGEWIVALVFAVNTWLARQRVYLELSVKRLTGQERPSV